MKKFVLLLLCGLCASQFLLAQNPAVEPPSSPPPAEKKPAKVERKKAENTTDETELAPPVVPPPKPAVFEKPEEIFKVVDQTPEYPDGEGAMLKYLYDNIRYPDLAKRRNVQGKVLVKFFVEKDGSINNAEIIKDIGSGCGAEALRVVYKMPRWNPGKPRGRPRRVQFILPIEFKIVNGNPVRPDKLNLESLEVDAKDYSKPADENEVFEYVESPPIWEGCGGIAYYVERKKCADEKIQQFINENLKYPRKARRNKIEGTVYVSFIIEKDGTISNAKLMSDIGGGCGTEALRVVNSMPKWTPGKQRGQLIRYQYELPIVFSLK